MTKQNERKSKTELELLNDINLKLDKLIGVLAIQSIKDTDDKIHLLKNLDFKSDGIGSLVGIKGTTVRDREGWKRK